MKKKKILAGTLCGLLLSSALSITVQTLPVNASTQAVGIDAKRIYGQDRYETGAKIVNEGWKSSTDYAVLAAGTDENLVDSLAAAPLAKLYDAPILLTERQSLNPYTEEELKRLNVKTVFLTTGTGVIQKEVINQLSALGITLVYLGGNDRFETSVNIAKEMAKVKPFKEIVMTTAWTNADALSIAPIAAMKGMPILLTDANAMPASIEAYVSTLKTKLEGTYILGGKSLVSSEVEASLPNPTRIAGIDRYETNIKVIEAFSQEIQSTQVYVANGENAHLVDALTVAPLAALLGAPVVLTDSNMSDMTKDYIQNKLEPAILVFLGSNRVIGDSVLDALKNPGGLPPIPVGGGAIPGIPSGSTGSIQLSNFKVITNPANTISGVENGGLIDLSNLDPATKITAISITANQTCTLQLDQATDLAGNALELQSTPPAVTLQAATPTSIQVSDIVNNIVDRPNGVQLSEFSFVFGSGAIFKGKVTQNGVTKGDVIIRLKFKN